MSSSLKNYLFFLVIVNAIFSIKLYSTPQEEAVLDKENDRQLPKCAKLDLNAPQIPQPNPLSLRSPVTLGQAFSNGDRSNVHKLLANLAEKGKERHIERKKRKREKREKKKLKTQIFKERHKEVVSAYKSVDLDEDLDIENFSSFPSFPSASGKKARKSTKKEEKKVIIKTIYEEPKDHNKQIDDLSPISLRVSKPSFPASNYSLARTPPLSRTFSSIEKGHVGSFNKNFENTPKPFIHPSASSSTRYMSKTEELIAEDNTELEELLKRIINEETSSQKQEFEDKQIVEEPSKNGGRWFVDDTELEELLKSIEESSSSQKQEFEDKQIVEEPFFLGQGYKPFDSKISSTETLSLPPLKKDESSGECYYEVDEHLPLQDDERAIMVNLPSIGQQSIVKTPKFKKYHPLLE